VSNGAVSALEETEVYAYQARIVSDRTRTWDAARAETAVRELLDSLGVDVSTEDTRRTPRRAEMYHEMLTPKPFKFTTFPDADHYDELVLVRAIPFVSLCAHHLLPFKGEAHVAYVPDERIVGLSKLARAVHQFAKALQVQERLTKQVLDLIQNELEPKGVGVVMEAEHECMTVRGYRRWVPRPSRRPCTASCAITTLAVRSPFARWHRHYVSRARCM
jgi:GTP cyclohydrolase I